MRKILLSIKPEYVNRIFSGTKRYEYRKRLAKEKVDEIIIYCTYPIMKVVGSVSIIGVKQGNPQELWEETENFSGIEYSDYMEYFETSDTAYAYVLGDFKKFQNVKLLKEYGIDFAPQSFVYL